MKRALSLLPILPCLLLALSACKSEGSAKPDGSKAEPSGGAEALKNPASFTAQAPAEFKAKFSTSKGDFVVTAHREWSPRGVDRFYNLVKGGFYDNVRFFRVVDGFMAQFGIHGDPEVARAWRGQNLEDDPVKQSNKRGFLSFAMAGKGSRTTQIFINFADNARLDGMGFAAFAEVTQGMDIVDSLNKEYGEGAPRGRGPDQGRMGTEGNAYLERDFPRLDFVKSARIVP